LGADDRSNARHARFVAPYDNRNSSEHIGAMAFIDPINNDNYTQRYRYNYNYNYYQLQLLLLLLHYVR